MIRHAGHAGGNKLGKRGRSVLSLPNGLRALYLGVEEEVAVLLAVGREMLREGEIGEAQFANLEQLLAGLPSEIERRVSRQREWDQQRGRDA